MPHRTSPCYRRHLWRWAFIWMLAVGISATSASSPAIAADCDQVPASDKINPEEQALAQSFQSQDQDGDGELNELEYVGLVAEADRAKVKQEFVVFDLDRSGKLTLAEYRTIPARTPPELRGPLPSPFAELVASHLEPIKSNWSKWDGDQNGTLSEAEFDASGLARSIAGFETSTWKDWDRDGDGKLTQADCQWLLEAGYGMRRLNGQLLHLSSGQVVYWWHFKEMDVNGDDRLTVAEFVVESSDQPGREARFQRDDTDKNGEISFKEWAESPGRRVDALAEFLSVDKNQDGRVDPAELQTGTAKWLQRITPSTFPGFDLDRDGSLTLHEYWSTLVVNRVENWLTYQTDLDHDGRLSPKEFAWLPGVELALLKAEYFRRFDVDRNGYLQLNEFTFIIDTAKVPADVLLDVTYGTLDADHDGQLSETEFVSPAAEGDRPKVRQELVVFDLNGDRKLSREEFRNIPSRIPPEGRGPLPSPFAKLVEKHLAQIHAGWANWDSDKDGTLSEAEFDASGLATSISGLEQSTWKDWDRDDDGSVSEADCRWLLEAGYGIRRLIGQLLHLPSGHVVYWWHFKELDANRDDRLTRAEFAPVNPDEKAREIRFTEDDADHDGEVSFKEWAESRNHQLDLVADFLSMDKNLDGRLDPAEFRAGNLPWLDPLPQFVFPAFDLDRDGKLSLDEFRGTLVMNRVENWLQRQKDVDGDGKLSLKEFAWLPGVELSLLKAEYFRRLDLDSSGSLKLDEFSYTIDSANISFEVTYKLLDKDGDGQLSGEEFLNSVSEASRSQAKQELAIFDLNRDGKLSQAEYRRIPTRVLPSQGGELPSPFASLVEERLKPIVEYWSKWDLDKNGKLSMQELPVSKLDRDLVSLVVVYHRFWDRDRDGQLDQADFRRMLEVGYGIRRLNDQLLHLPSGQFVYWWHFKELDVNRDDRLTHAEFLLESSNRAATESRRQQDDTDQDGEVSFQEWAESRNHRIDPLAEFLNLDKNFDGRVSRDELQAGTPAWLQKLSPNVFPGFDLDGDGTLTLEEYGRTLLANRVENWLIWRQDRNGDGRLDLQEFLWQQGPELGLLIPEYFRRFDVDRSGFLELSEFPFLIDPLRAPPAVAFQHLDLNHDGLLNLEEAFADPEAVTRAEKNPDLKARLTRTEKAFQKADRNHDEYLSPEEFASPEGKFVLKPDALLEVNTSIGADGRPVINSRRSVILPVIVFNAFIFGWAIFYPLLKNPKSPFRREPR